MFIVFNSYRLLLSVQKFSITCRFSKICIKCLQGSKVKYTRSFVFREIQLLSFYPSLIKLSFFRCLTLCFLFVFKYKQITCVCTHVHLCVCVPNSIRPYPTSSTWVISPKNRSWRGLHVGLERWASVLCTVGQDFLSWVCSGLFKRFPNDQPLISFQSSATASSPVMTSLVHLSFYVFLVIFAGALCNCWVNE